jgi:hypothetical protein
MRDDLDTALADLQHSLANVSTLHNICMSMKDNTSKLLSALKSTLEDTRSGIDRALTLLPAVALGVRLLTDCSGVVADFQMLEAFAKSSNVSYDNADAWKCDVTKVPNTKGVVEDCGVCVNVDGRSQVVTINGERSLVEPQGTVIRCSDRAWVRDRTMPPLAPTSERQR